MWSSYMHDIQTFPPFWWLDTGFGQLVFVLFFLTWGLVVVWLVLSILKLIRDLFGR
jgi:hypothetical protein